MPATPDTWLMYHRPNPHARLRLICFPYAGGSASVFRQWAQHLPSQIEVCPVQLPGRENRLHQPPVERMEALIAALAPALQPLLTLPYAFFGHSLGALIGFELARHLRRMQLPLPLHLFVSAARAPHLPDPDAPIHHLPDAAFRQELRLLQGTPDEILQHEELFQLLLPCLRADFALFESYRYRPEAPLAIPLTVFGGRQDRKVSLEALAAWREHTQRACVTRLLPGDHFFLRTAFQPLLQAMQYDLASKISLA
ncbi:MAG: thioesterase II family protein [Chloroflexota bacterium]